MVDDESIQDEGAPNPDLIEQEAFLANLFPLVAEQNQLTYTQALKKSGVGRDKFIRWCGNPQFMQLFHKRVNMYYFSEYSAISKVLVKNAKKGDNNAIRTYLSQLDKLQGLIGRANLINIQQNYFATTDTPDDLVEKAMNIVEKNRMSGEENLDAKETG